MAVTTIKSYNSDNQAEVTADHELKVTGDINANNSSVGPTGDPVPPDATLVAGKDPSGNLVPVAVDSDGHLIVSSNGDSGAFDTLSPGYPTQISVGTTSITLLPANPLRKYGHVSNNSGEAIFIQFQSSAALNQGVKIGPGGFYTLEVNNLYRGDINAIGLMAGQLIDVVEGI